MQFRKLWLAGMVLGLFTANAHATAPSPNATWPFEENGGRYPANVAYAGHVSTGGVFVTTDGKVVHALRSKDQRGWSLVESIDGVVSAPLAGKRSAVAITRFHGSATSRLRAFESLRFDLGGGIASELRLRQGGVERLFEIAPGAATRSLRVRLDGARTLSLDRDGAMRINTGAGDLRLSPPVAWQISGATKTPVAVAYRLHGKAYSFALGAHDAKRTVFIDPLLQSTYVGGTGAEAVFGLAMGTDRVYVSGGTSGSFPGTAGGAQPSPATTGVESDAYIAAFSLDLKTLLGATYLGGDGTDFGPAILVTGDSVYLAGSTDSTDFPGRATGAQPAFGGGSNTDGFIARLSLNLATLMRSTYLGGTGTDQVTGLTLANNSIYATGFTGSTLTGTTGAAQTSLNGPSDAFAARFSVDLGTLTRLTYLGGSGDDSANGHPLATADSLYVVGATDSKDFPHTAGGVQPSIDPLQILSVAFISRLSLDLSQNVQSTYYNDSANFAPSGAYGVAAGFGDVYVYGRARGSGLPGIATGAQPTYNGGFFDLWVARFSPTLTSIVRATYYGGSGDEEVATNGLVVSPDGVFITGSSNSPTLPGTAGGIQENKAGPNPENTDAFVARLTTDLTTLQQATWFGDQFYEAPHGLGRSAGGIVYVAGSEDSSGRPGAAGGAISDYAGGDSDGFLAAMTPDLAAVAPQPSISIGDASDVEGNSGSKLFTFLVTLSSPPASNVTVTVQTVQGTATSGVDYLAMPPTTLTFTPFDPLTKQVTVQVVGDFEPEQNEEFTVTLTNPNGATIADGTGTGTIINDDAGSIPALSGMALAALALALTVMGIVVMKR